MIILDYAICVLLILSLAGEVFIVLKRNKNILLKGKDDFFTYSLIMLFVLLIFPLSQSTLWIENLRNILLLVTVFASAGIKRGFSEKGLEKICFTVPWKEISEVHINSYQNSKIQVICRADKFKWKLYFGKYHLKEVLRELERHGTTVYMQDGLQEVLSMKKY